MCVQLSALNSKMFFPTDSFVLLLQIVYFFSKSCWYYRDRKRFWSFLRVVGVSKQTDLDLIGATVHLHICFLLVCLFVTWSMIERPVWLFTFLSISSYVEAQMHVSLKGWSDLVSKNGENFPREKQTFSSHIDRAAKQQNDPAFVNLAFSFDLEKKKTCFVSIPVKFCFPDPEWLVMGVLPTTETKKTDEELRLRVHDSRITLSEWFRFGHLQAICIMHNRNCWVVFRSMFWSCYCSKLSPVRTLDSG